MTMVNKFIINFDWAGADKFLEKCKSYDDFVSLYAEFRRQRYSAQMINSVENSWICFLDRALDAVK